MDVTVVGAGPVGLVLAAELALSGATVRVIERRARPDEAMKAQSINVPTAEALDRRGLLPAPAPIWSPGCMPRTTHRRSPHP
ncbi:FAD-dependent oxidoreductase, partial [Streptomyces sp. NPDC055037]